MNKHYFLIGSFIAVLMATTLQAKAQPGVDFGYDVEWISATQIMPKPDVHGRVALHAWVSEHRTGKLPESMYMIANVSKGRIVKGAGKQHYLLFPINQKELTSGHDAQLIEWIIQCESEQSRIKLQLQQMLKTSLCILIPTR